MTKKGSTNADFWKENPSDEYWTEVIDQVNVPEDPGMDFDPSMVSFGGEASHSVIDEVLGTSRLGSVKHTSMRALTDKAREASALKLPVNAGTRVAFKVNLGSVMTYSDVPHPACEGTVITVRTAEGPMTHQASNVFVLWDDGKFRSIRAEHLKPGTSKKTASNFRMVASSLGDLSEMFGTVKTGGDELIHKATKDLWSCRKEGGQFVIERLFDDTGKPLKV